MELLVKYHDKKMPELDRIEIGDWVDVRAVKVSINGVHKPFREGKPVIYAAGDIVKVDLGVSVQLPEGYEAYLAPRSSTFNNYGLIQTNSVGIVDETYCGDNDIWGQQFYALRPGKISKYDRVGQFRIMPKMGEIEFKKVDKLGNADRGGYGTTGKK